MKTLKELQTFAEELSSADKVLCDAVADGTYRLGEVKFSEPVDKMLRSVFQDLIGHQEAIDLSIFEGEDPEQYLRMHAGEEEGYPEVLETLFDPSVSKKEKRKAWKFMDTEGYKLYEKLLKQVKSSLVFCAYTLASRRDRLRIREKKEEAKVLVEDLLGYSVDNHPSREDAILTGLTLMGFVPTEAFEHVEIIFKKDRYRAYESKLILEVPYSEFLANLFEGDMKEDYFGLFGILTEEDAKEALQNMHVPDEELRKELVELIKSWDFYRFTDFGISIAYAQGTFYKQENYEKALEYLKRLEPKTKLEHLLTGRAWENLGRNLQDRSFLKTASHYYQRAENIVKALECEAL